MRILNILHPFKAILPLFAVLIATSVGCVSAQEMAGALRDFHVNRDTTLVFSVSDFKVEAIGDSAFLIACNETNTFNMGKGAPMLPQFVRMVSTEPGATIGINIVAEEWDTVSIDGRRRPLAAPGARPKNEEYTVQKFDLFSQSMEEQKLSVTVFAVSPQLQKNMEEQKLSVTVFAESSQLQKNIRVAKLISLGVMRDRQVARLTVSPFFYDPEHEQLLVCKHLKINISICGDAEISAGEPQAGCLRTTTDSGNKDYSNDTDFQSQPIHYAVVAPEQFRQTLQRFVSWKRQEGYIVEEMYFDTPRRDEIKARLQERHDQVTADNPMPLYLLLVGDAAEIPYWMGQQRISGLERHITDFPYAEYTGDSLPDIMLGRWSASDTATLSAIIDKTLSYERYTMGDSSHLNRSLLVAGEEDIDPAPTVTNGQVNYLKKQITSKEPTNDTLCYYNPLSASQHDEILEQFGRGVGLVSYTSHCSTGGWRNPTIVSSDIDSLPENGSLFIAVNNCCRSNAFASDCFGEHLLRKARGGAVAVIGATNETLWDEDYYWSVGNRQSISETPEYDSLALGAYDRLLHTHGETTAQQASTMGQMLLAGNWAVSRSGSQFDAFYWEIYCLLGDPSLTPYVGIPATLHLQHDTIHCGDIAVSFHGTPYARIAITRNDTLMGLCTIDSTGEGTAHCTDPLTGSVTITATLQFHRPWQATILPEGCPTESTEQPADGADKIHIHPIPAKESVTITGFSERTHITIIDMTGRTIDELWASKDATIQYSTDKLRCGVYCILLESPSIRTAKKIVIQK